MILHTIAKDESLQLFWLVFRPPIGLSLNEVGYWSVNSDARAVDAVIALIATVKQVKHGYSRK